MEALVRRITFFAIAMGLTLPSLGQNGSRHAIGLDHYSSWVDSTLSQLTIEEKIGQMIQSRVYGDYPNADDPAFRAAQAEIETYHLGSVVLGGRMSGPNLSKGTPLQVANILNSFQRGSKLPLLVASDLENDGSPTTRPFVTFL